MSSSDNPQIEKKMLTGCTGYVMLSLGGFVVGTWPFFLYTHHWLISELVKCAALGLVPSLLLGILGTRKYGVPGAAGFFASALATAIFIYLRLWQMFMGWEAQRSPEPEYPAAFMWLIPICWVLLVAFLAIFALSGTKSKDRLD